MVPNPNDPTVTSIANRLASQLRRSPFRSLVGGAVVLAGAKTLRRRMLRWGATRDELRLVVPGDDLLPTSNLTATRAITIAATPAEVWPWIAQLGQGRGGFYTYDWLENLVGANIHSANMIVPALQHPAVGDDIRLAPEVALRVAVVEPDRALVLRGGIPIGNVRAPYDFTWAFALSHQLDGSTRLIVRERYAYAQRWAALLVEPTEVVSFVMTQRMLRGIKARAERGSGVGSVARLAE